MLTERTLALLAEHPDGLTSREIADALGTTQTCVAAVISRITKHRRRVGRRAHICGWQDDHPGTRKYPRARYALGNRRDVPKPAVDAVARHREQHHLRSARSVTSVFDLGLTVSERLAGKRAAL